MVENVSNLMLFVSAGLLIIGIAGFSMINVGLSRAHASATLCVASVGMFAFSILAYDLIGHRLMFGGASGELLAAFASVIVLGALTERIKIWPCMIFAALFGGFVFPSIGQWVWGGWIADLGFHDFSGASVIHIAAGSAALAGCHVLGPRAGRYAPDGRPIPFSASNVPLATLGAFLACAGWMGVASGRGLYDTSGAFTNLLLGAAGGASGAFIYTTWRYNKPDATIIINGLLAGLVSVSAGADIFWSIFSAFTGCVGGVLCAYIVPLLDKHKFDDPIGVVPVHFVGGIWGCIAVIFTGNIAGQLAGLVIVTVFAVGASIGVWLAIKRVTGLRCSARAERHGLDMEAVGLEAYADFPIRTAGRPDITQIDRY